MVEISFQIRFWKTRKIYGWKKFVYAKFWFVICSISFLWLLFDFGYRLSIVFSKLNLVVEFSFGLLISVDRSRSGATPRPYLSRFERCPRLNAHTSEEMQGPFVCTDVKNSFFCSLFFIYPSFRNFWGATVLRFLFRKNKLNVLCVSGVLRRSMRSKKSDSFDGSCPWISNVAIEIVFWSFWVLLLFDFLLLPIRRYLSLFV